MPPLVLFLLAAAFAPAVAITGDLVFFDNTKCDSGDELREITKKSDDLGTNAWKKKAKCFEACHDDGGCRLAQYDKQDKKCVHFSGCEKLEKRKGFNFAARPNEGKYYCAPEGVRCDKADCPYGKVLAEVKAGSVARCKKECSSEKGCKHLEFFGGERACKLYKDAPTLAFSGGDVVSCKKAKPT